MKEPKQIFVEGKLIGEVPTTGDVQKDLEAAIGLMRAKGVYKKITAEQVIFGQAVAFANTAAYLFNNDLLGTPPRNPMSTGPFVVNATFAIELYLKTLNRLYGNDIGRTHDLLRLFLALPDEGMQAVHREFSIALPRPACITDIKTFQAEIERVRHFFMEWRYLHERKHTGEVRFPELIFVRNVLHNTCRSDAKLKPGPSSSNERGAIA
jgi:hypothetical protein